VILPSLYDYLDIGEASLENCLPADQTTPAPYTKLDLVKPFVSELQKSSRERISHSKDFAYLMEDIDQVKKRQEEKTVSLNEKARMDEKEQDKARLEARKKERASRVASTSHIFELDLDMVEKDKPLQPFVASKSKEDADLAQATAAKSSDPELEDDSDSDTEPAVDPQLDETLNILRDYMQALKKEHKNSVVIKSE
jgi:carboxyl-terminal processing protease